MDHATQAAKRTELHNLQNREVRVQRAAQSDNADELRAIRSRIAELLHELEGIEQ